jgi:hypothetical protein
VIRAPQNLSQNAFGGAGPSPLEIEIAAEKAASLGRAGKLVKQRLEALRAAQPEDREILVRDAADAVYALIVQRELCGMPDAEPVVRDYRVPAEVVACLGAKLR